jgi:hypothetical protein
MNERKDENEWIESWFSSHHIEINVQMMISGVERIVTMKNGNGKREGKMQELNETLLIDWFQQEQQQDEEWNEWMNNGKNDNCCNHFTNKHHLNTILNADRLIDSFSPSHSFQTTSKKSNNLNEAAAQILIDINDHDHKQTWNTSLRHAINEMCGCGSWRKELCCEMERMKWREWWINEWNQKIDQSRKKERKKHWIWKYWRWWVGWRVSEMRFHEY